MIPVDLPPPPHIVQPVPIENRCVVAASAYYNLPPELIVAVRIQEAGTVGKVSKITETSYDMGPMQINSQHISKFASFGISEKDLIENECTNLFAGAYMLRYEINRAGGDLWRGVGRYHSPTDHRQVTYRNLVAQRLRNLYRYYTDYVKFLRASALKLRQQYVASGIVPTE